MKHSEIQLFPFHSKRSDKAVQLSLVLHGHLEMDRAPDPVIKEAHFRVPGQGKLRWTSGTGPRLTYSELKKDKALAQKLLDGARRPRAMKGTPAVSTLEANSLSEVLTWAEWLRVQFPVNDFWFRGQRAKSWPLKTRLARSASVREKGVLDHFRRGVPSRHPRIAPPSSHIQLMSLAQHYGAPTRLLDWSKSLLTALFFAVDGKRRRGTEAAVSVLLPQQLNRDEEPLGGLLTDMSPAIEEMARRTISSDSLARNDVLAFLPTHIDERQRLQTGTFTVHATRHPLEAHSRSREALYKITIGGTGIARISADLEELFGITRGYLFPDWQGLGDESEQLGRSRLRAALTNYIVGHPMRQPIDPAWLSR